MRAIRASVIRFVARPRTKVALAFALLLALTLLAGFFLGRHTAYRDVEAIPLSIERMQGDLSAARAAIKVARGDLEILRTRREVDSRALELLRSEMAAEKERTADLEEGLRFYRSMVVAEDMADGLSLRVPELVAGQVPGRVAYRIFVQQKEREYEIVEGTLSVELFGLKGETEVSYPLSELSEDFDQKTAALRFRYFQAIEGELVLPEGFEPSGLTVTARASKPREIEIREQFPWKLQEQFINVGK